MKRIIGSSVMMLAVLAVVITGTGAFFSDTETSSGNVFTAGNIDLMINHTAQTYNGVNCATCTVILESDTNHVVTAKDGEDLDTPFNAVEPESPGPNWAEPVGDAVWIWGEEDMPDGDDTTSYTFLNTFTWWGNAGSVTIDMQLAADDDYVIYLNGTEVENGTNAWQNVETFTIDENQLVQGTNEIEFVVTNSGGFRAGLMYQMTITEANCEAGVADFQATCELWQSTNLTNETFFNFSDIKPQDSGTNLVSMTVESNEAYLCLRVDEDTNASVLGNGGGNLGDYLQVLGWYADEDGNITDGTPAFGPTDASDLASVTYADSTSSPVTPGETQYLLLEWCMGDMSVDGTTTSCDGNVPNINDTQAAQYVANLQFFAIQSRNNDTFMCADAVFGDGEDGDDSIVFIGSNDLAENLAAIETNPLSWFFFEDGAGIPNPFMEINQYSPDGENDIVVGPEGVGAAKMLLHDNSRYNIATYQFAGTSLASLTSLQYRVYDASASSQTPYLHFNVDFDGSDSWQNRLVMVPTAPGNNGVPFNTWTTVDALDDGDAVWCWSGMTACGGSATSWPAQTGTAFADPTAGYQTWDDIVAAYPSAALRTNDPFFGVRVGHPGPVGEESYVDWIEFNGVQYNFTN